jgi:hypothetical protein
MSSIAACRIAFVHAAGCSPVGPSICDTADTLTDRATHPAQRDMSFAEELAAHMVSLFHAYRYISLLLYLRQRGSSARIHDHATPCPLVLAKL